jgi:hypothetical protein
MTDSPTKPERHDDGSKVRSTHYALEIVFLGLIFLVVLVAFAEAFTYKLVSSRTPFVIMVPLLVLILYHAIRLLRGDVWRELQFHLSAAVTGRYKPFNKLAALAATFFGLGAIILVFGHAVGIFTFMLFLMNVLGREKLMLSLIVSAVATALIVLLFEKGFNIELYRGLLFRYMAGYKVF